jgi:hypothetical protein
MIGFVWYTRKPVTNKENPSNKEVFMYVEEKGHVYRLAKKGCADSKDQILKFVNQEPGKEHPGTTTQEVIRALIDRTRHCNNCMPHPNNERIIYHLRMALVLHEARALERRTEKGEIRPEFLRTENGAHISVLEENIDLMGQVTPNLDPPPFDGAKTATYRYPTHQMAEGCCSAVSPCAHQRNDPTTICDTCQLAAVAHERVF